MLNYSSDSFKSDKISTYGPLNNGQVFNAHLFMPVFHGVISNILGANLPETLEPTDIRDLI